MFETNESEIEVEQLKTGIRKATDARRSDAEKFRSSFAVLPRFELRKQNDSVHQQPPPLGALGSDVNIGAASVEEFQLAADDRYHARDLLKYHDKEFVHNAYRAVLKREPDEAGEQHQLECLRSGYFNKIDVLASLRFSPEGRSHNVRIDGLRIPAFVRSIGRLPVIGYGLQLAIAIARLPIAARHHRQFESHALVQQQQLAERIETISNETVHRIQMIEQQIVEHMKLIDNQVTLFTRQHHRMLADTGDALADITKTKETIHSWFVQADHNLKQQVRAMTGLVEDRTRQLSNIQKQMQLEVALQQRQLSELLDEARQQSPSSLDDSRPQALIDEAEHVLDAFYAALQERFRGTTEEISERLQIYLPFLQNAQIEGDVLDVGCGRGEWLDMLREVGIKARGVDTNRLMIEHCRMQNLNVIEADAMAYLSSLPDNSLSAVTSFHFIEHLPFHVLIRFLNEVLRVLEPGGIIILETPNPENILVGTNGFHLDPTHQRPLPYLLMQFLLQFKGFNHVEVMMLHPLISNRISGSNDLTAKFNDFFFGHMDYAVIGAKPRTANTSV